jgi:small subunit ribosomal protein S2
MKELLEAGVHFGHQTKRWNPRMKEYIFGERNGIYIVDLQKTLRLFKEALNFAMKLGAEGKAVLFVGTKRQAQDVVAEEAKRASMFYVNQRWLGGTLTNFVTIRKSIGRYRELTAMMEEGRFEELSKKELSRLDKERRRLEKNLIGIQDMEKLPDAVFIVDANREEIAVHEARKLGIPVIAIVDTNCDPRVVDYVIPGNDDALRAIKLFTSRIADAVIAGREMRKAPEPVAAEAAGGAAGESATDTETETQAQTQTQTPEAAAPAPAPAPASAETSSESGGSSESESSADKEQSAAPAEEPSADSATPPA